MILKIVFCPSGVGGTEVEEGLGEGLCPAATSDLGL